MAYIEKPSPRIKIIRGGSNTVAVIHNSSALLFDCCEAITPELLSNIGISKVDAVICTSYRRTRLSGLYNIPEVTIYAPEKEAYLIENPETFWVEEKYRWHPYSYMPDTDVLPRSPGIVTPVNENWSYVWNDIKITALSTPVNSFGALSYIFKADGIEWCVCGDTVYSGGRMLEIYSMQGNEDDRRGYHGFLATRSELFKCMDTLSLCDRLIPAHGDIIENPKQDLNLLKDRLTELYDNFARISCLNYYFPHYPMTAHMKNPEVMPFCQTLTPPDWMSYVDSTSNIIISEDKSAFLIDCGQQCVIDKLSDWLEEGRIKSIDGCFITHSHDDHVDAVAALKKRFGCEIYVIDIMQDITEHPERYLTPCISPNAVKVTAISDRAIMQWKEFKLEFFRLPGQTLYHGGLMFDGYGERVFFAGDSGGPSGIDDYCCRNRCFNGSGRGFLQVFDIWEEVNPDYIINQHQLKAFKFNLGELDFMRKTLLQREKILSELLPWESPDFGIDNDWARAYPYEQTAHSGDIITISIEFTNHSFSTAEVKAEPILPYGFEFADKQSIYLNLPPRTSGFTYEYVENPDLKAEFTIKLSETLKQGLYIIPFNIIFNKRELGWFRHTVLKIIN
ncbi:MAG: Methylcarbamate-degrading protein [Clostridia bacterium]|nr:Methylcarbamate-degrading protein [Clostridia bacterium]